MDARGGQADQLVALFDGRTVNQGLPFDHTHGESGQVVLVRLVHVGHLSGLPAYQGGPGLDAAVGHALDHLLQQSRVIVSAGDVIQED